jgi:basic membrane protein A and related proteins
MTVRTHLRILAVLAAAGLALAACGEAPDEENGDGAAPEETYLACMVTDIGGIDDRSFNASAWAGLEQAQEQNQTVDIDSVSSSAEADYVPNLTGFVQDRECDFVLAVGGLMTDATTEVAEAHADQQFGIVDAATGQPNVYPMQFDTAQAAFLAGYLAAGYSASGIVGTYGGLPIPPVTIFMDGFVDGVAHYNDVKGTDVQVLGWDKDTQQGAFADSFIDQAAGAAQSDALVAQGADVIMPVAGGTGLGTASAAQESGDFVVIWVDIDGCVSAEQYCDTFLTTVVKNIPLAVQGAVLEAADADGLITGEFLGTLENDGVSLAPYHEFEDQIDDDLKTEIEQLRQDIIDGTIEVTSPAQPG